MKKIILSLFLVTACFTGKAQTFPITQIQQACNHNGILVVSVPFTPTFPIVYTWYYGSHSKSDTTNAVTDTLKTYDGSNAYCIISCNGANYQSNSFSSPPFTYTLAVTNPMCPATLGSGTVTVNGGQAPYTVQWYSLNTLAVVATGQIVNSLPQGMCDMEITDANGCTFGGKEQSDSVFIMQQSPVQVSVTTTTASCTNGTASVTTVTGGLTPYSYLWNTGQTTSSISNLVMGYYTAIVTDAQGCSGRDVEYVPQSITINVNVVPTAATCIQNNGSAIAFGSGGQTPYTYIYSSGQTTQTATGLLGNNYYSVQVTDANSCIGSVGFSVNATTPISVTYSASPSSCTSPTGSATLSISGGQTPYVIDWFTTPAQSGATVSNLISGTYSFKVTDANGCVQSGSAYIPPVSDLSAYPYATSAVCPSNNGAAAVSAYSSYMPITYLWSNNATTSSINNLSAGSYNCIITDALGCQKFKTVYVYQTSPIQLNFNTSDATCIFRNDGKINLTPTGGLTPYTYAWVNNGLTIQNLTNLATNFYTVTVVDANGCSTTDTTYVGYNAANDSCYCTVTGEVFYDVNGNCIIDNGEAGVENILIKNNNTITAGNINNYAFTDNAGFYNFILPTGSYNMQEVIQYLYPLSSCQSNTNNLTLTAAHGCTYTVNFANTINPLHDVHLYNINMNMPEPGQNYIQQIVVENDGTVAENNVQFGYAHDGQLSFVSSSGINLTQPNVTAAPNWYDNTNTVLNPGASTVTQITYAVPTNIPMGTVVNFWDTTAYAAPMNNWLNDYTPWNNINAYDAIVVASYDPNFIDVSPKGVGPLGLVSATDTVFDYVIHFQNTGTAAANKIVVKDSIDADFNIESLKPGYSNHNYIASIDNHNVLTFTFNNINLPDMNNYPIGSIGVVAYSIHAKKNLVAGTQFKSTAAIYFDYNAPVITNTTINTINSSAGINEIKSTDNSMSLFPNPTADNYSLKITTEEENVKALVSVYSLDGSLVSENNINLSKGANMFDYSVANFTAGLYIVRVTEGGRQHITKLSVVK